MAGCSPLRSVLKDTREIIDMCLHTSASTQDHVKVLDASLNEALFQLSNAVETQSRSKVSYEEGQDLWHISVSLWKWCAQLQNSSAEVPWWLHTIWKHTSAFVESLPDDVPSTDRPSKLAIHHEAGVAQAKAGQHEDAEAAYGRAHEQAVRLVAGLQNGSATEAELSRNVTACLGVTLDRLSNALKLRQKALASDLLSQASRLAEQAGLPGQQRFHVRRQVIQACVDQGRQCLRAQDKNALLLVKHAYKLISEDLELCKDDANFKQFRTETNRLNAQVLRLLAQAYLLGGQAAAALECVQSMRQLRNPPDDNPKLCLLAIQANIQLREREQVDAELLALVTHKKASANLCLAGLTAVIKAPGCPAPQHAAKIAVGRYPKDAKLAQSVMEVALNALNNKGDSEFYKDPENGTFAEHNSPNGEAKQQGVDGIMRTLSQRFSGPLLEECGSELLQQLEEDGHAEEDIEHMLPAPVPSVMVGRLPADTEAYEKGLLDACDIPIELPASPKSPPWLDGPGDRVRSPGGSMFELDEHEGTVIYGTGLEPKKGVASERKGSLGDTEPPVTGAPHEECCPKESGLQNLTEQTQAERPHERPQAEKLKTEPPQEQQRLRRPRSPSAEEDFEGRAAKQHKV